MFLVPDTKNLSLILMKFSSLSKYLICTNFTVAKVEALNSLTDKCRDEKIFSVMPFLLLVIKNCLRQRR